MSFEYKLKGKWPTILRKMEFLASFKRQLCHISNTCKKAGINRRTFSRWKLEDSEFKMAVEDLKDNLIDDYAFELHKKAMKGDLRAIIFFLKTQGKHRGWTEKTEVKQNITQNTVIVRIIKPEEINE